MADVDLDARLDELFSTDPNDFIATRNALVRDLEATDRTETGAAIKALRKPTVAVAAVNRVAREHPTDVAELIDLGADLSALQSHGRADRDDLRTLARQRRTLLQQLTERAARTMERPAGARSSIAATLDAASLAADLLDDLRRGRLTHELSPPARFVTGDNTPDPRATSRQSTGSTPAARSSRLPLDELAARRARVELVVARDRAGEAARSMREHAAATAEAVERIDVAHRQVAELEAALVDARAHVADAKRAARAAQRAEQRARTEQERADVALAAAQRAVDETT